MLTRELQMVRATNCEQRVDKRATNREQQDSNLRVKITVDFWSTPLTAWVCSLLHCVVFSSLGIEAMWRTYSNEGCRLFRLNWCSMLIRWPSPPCTTQWDVYSC